MRILVTGDREWTDYKIIHDALAGADSVCHGGARGADSLADEAVRQSGYQPQVYKADWAKHGKAAGPIRNQQMLVEFRPTHVYAFHDNLENSKGTKDMVKRALKAGVLVIHFSHQHTEGIILNKDNSPISNPMGGIV